MNDKITYVFGHKNPDTDSVCAAIALSYLKNQLGMTTMPVVLGNINPETSYALQYFNVKEPHHLNDVKLQLKDVAYHKGVFIDKDKPIKDAFDLMNMNSLTGIPIVEGKNKFYGYVSLKEIAREIINGVKTLKFDKEISGKVLAATYAKETFINNVTINESSILIIGDRKTILEY